jgi:hypothetical protein
MLALLKRRIFALTENTFEIGGKNKSNIQVRNLEYAYLALDGLTIGFQNEIPLWLFGFLY